MIVITIFATFILATSIFDGKPQTNIEKTDRMQIAVSGILRNEMQNIIIGKMPRNGGQTASKTVLTIGTGGIYTSYITGSTEIGSGSFAVPYFDGDAIYAIKNVTWTGSSGVPNGISGTGQVIIQTTGVSFSGVGITGSGYSLLEVKLGYNNTIRKVTLDRRTGKISETKQ